jgi:hypothetical protein
VARGGDRGLDEAPPDPRLDDRVVELLAAHPGRLAFNGLRRTLGAHPESLTRALRRLERDGLVVRDEGGYMLRADQAPPVRPPGPDAEVTRTVASVALPPGLAASDVLGSMAGRWFGRLRWVGVYEHPGDPWLVWSVGTGPGQVLLSVHRGTLRIRINRGRDDPLSAELEDAAHDLLVQGLTRVRRADRGADPGVVLFAREPRSPVVGPN